MEWDEEAERIATSYAGRDFREPKIVQRDPIYMCSGEEIDLGQFVADLQGILGRVPTEFRDTAKVVYETGHYDSGDCFKVVYCERETPEEVADRVGCCWQYVQERRAADRAEFERLKAKFADNEKEPGTETPE